VVILVDSSVWIAIEHGRGLLSFASEDDDVAICPVVATEVLRGTQNLQRYKRVLTILAKAKRVDSPTPYQRFEEAARIYLQCRNAGVTPSTVDCLIAASAIAHHLPLLTVDHDFHDIARVVTSLRLFTRS
jgi:hypothetical protein